MEILRTESPCLEEGKGNGISERHLKRRRRSGSASDRARFHWGVKGHDRRDGPKNYRPASSHP